jgi:hypothetical protein
VVAVAHSRIIAEATMGLPSPSAVREYGRTELEQAGFELRLPAKGDVNNATPYLLLDEHIAIPLSR